MSFAEKLADLRRERGLTQQALAERAKIHQSQVHRYESGAALPTFEVLRGISVALSVSADELLFDEHEREPETDLKLYFEALSRLDDEEKKTVRDVLDALLLKHDARRWTERKAG